MNILFLQKRFLYPANTGGRIRTLNVLRYLSQWHNLTYLCNVQLDEQSYLPKMQALGMQIETVPWSETPRGSMGFYRDLAINLLSAYPYNVSKDFDPALRARAVSLLQERAYDLVICDFVQMARNCIGLGEPEKRGQSPFVRSTLRAVPAKDSRPFFPPKLLFQHNVEAQIFERHARADRGWFRRWYMARQWRKMQRFEAEAGSEFDAVVAVSAQDRRTFEQEYGWRHVRTIDTGVDVHYFQPNGYKEQSNRVVFLGSLDWLPNQDGVRYFVEEVWPLVRRTNPDARFQIVGRSPSREILRLHEKAGVDVVGTVPDVRPYLGRAAVVVVPLLVGGGTRIKIVEAMAMGKAIVSTPLGAEGLPVQPGEHLLLADTPAEFASRVSDLLRNAEQRARLGNVARELVTKTYTAEAVARQFEAICVQTVEASQRERNEKGVGTTL